MHRLLSSARSVSRVAVLVLLTAVAVHADGITVMSSGAMSAALRELIPAFERESGSTLTVVSGGSVAGAADSIPDRLQRGERADVVIMAAAGIDELAKAGHLVAGSRVDLARSSIGIAVRAGAPKPDIVSVEALKQALLAAKSVAYSASVSGVYISTELFQQLGIAAEMRSKSRKVDGEPVGAVIARGEAELGFQQISELRPVPGVEVVGPLPAEVQRVTVFSAATGARSANPAGGRALIGFLSSPAAAAAIAKSGMDPVSRR
jgi:molybdate transport system substrate-binding protein